MIEFNPTPFGTVHVTALVPTEDVKRTRRSIASQVGRRGLGKRLSTAEHRFGAYTRVFAIYRKG